MASSPSRVSGAFVGVALALGGWAAFSLQDAIVKYLVVSLPVPEVLFARSVLICLFAATFARRQDLMVMTERRALVAILIRSAFIFAAWIAYYTSSRSLQLAQMVTLYFAGPLFVVAMSGPALGERVGPGRWFATLLGFAGVLVAANPTGGGDFTPSALALAAALCWAITTLLARTLTGSIATAALMIGSNATFVVACGALGPSLFVTPGRWQLCVLLGLGLVGSLGQYLWFEGVRRAQASLLAPLEYTLLAYAIFWGWLIFGDWPNARTLAGAGVILISGIVAVAVEARRTRFAPQA
jgi:S-adenosylmethionine uptake transporter